MRLSCALSSYGLYSTRVLMPWICIWNLPVQFPGCEEGSNGLPECQRVRLAGIELLPQAGDIRPAVDLLHSAEPLFHRALAR